MQMLTPRRTSFDRALPEYVPDLFPRRRDTRFVLAAGSSG
jgi:hypothetical protein